MGMTHAELNDHYAPELRRLAIRDLLVKGLRRHLTELRRGDAQPSTDGADGPPVAAMHDNECLHPASSFPDLLVGPRGA
jgi:hypothetical protein